MKSRVVKNALKLFDNDKKRQVVFKAKTEMDKTNEAMKTSLVK